MPSHLLPSSANPAMVRVSRRAQDFLTQSLPPAGGVAAVADLRDDALQPDLAGERVYLGAVDLEVLAELDVGVGDDLLELRLALDQGQLLQVVAVEIEEVEGHQHDPGGCALQFVLQDGEVGGAVLDRDDDFAVDDGGAGADVPGVVGDLRKRLVQSLPRRVKTLAAASLRWTWIR
jgi:hypothetical protein